MHSGDFRNHPNPFALHIDGNRPSKSSFKTAAKFFVIIALLFCLTVAVGSQSRKWIANRLMSGFSELQVPEKQQRLAQISELGTPGLELLVDALLDPETEVALTAYELLRQSQNHWTSLDWSESRTYHGELIKQLSRISPAIPDDRTGYTTALVQQTIMESVQKQDDVSKRLYNFASQTLAAMSLSTSTGPRFPADPSPDQARDQGDPVRLTVRSKPLPVADANALGVWTDWPSAQPSLLESSSHRPSESSSRETALPGLADEMQKPEPETNASVYRPSASRLRPVENDEKIVLRDIHAVPRSTPNVLQSESNIIPTSYLSDSAFESYDNKSVIHWLGSEQGSLRAKAKLELMRRDFSAEQIEIATQIVAADPASRLALVDAIARSRIENPRPWLSMLLDDENREVRLQTISVIATMDDPEMTAELRGRLDQERDPIVNARIRRVLKLR